MHALLALFPKDTASRTEVLREGSVTFVGRDPANEIVLSDARVSARHARLSWNGKGWSLLDLASKNGTYLNGRRLEEEALPASEDWISFGGLPAQLTIVSEEGVRAFQAERVSRIEVSAELRLSLEAEPDPHALLERLVESALTLAGAERSFVLVRAAGGALHAELEIHATPGERRHRFSGSRGAVEQVLATGRSVVASDAQTEEFLGKRPSVVELGLKSLACIPLHEGGRVIGVLYLDGKRGGASFNELDLEILEGLADRAAILLAGARLGVELRELDAALIAEVSGG